MIKKIETIYIILGIAIIVLLAIAGFFIISLETAAPSNANLEKNENTNRTSSNSNKSDIQGAEDSKNNNSNSASAANVNQINDNLNTRVNSSPSREAAADNENKNTTVNTNKPAASGVKTFNVTAKSWTFEPKTIKVKKGDKVVLNIKATDVAHGFMIPEFNIDEMLPAGKTTKVEFTASKSDTFTFSCSWICGEGHSKMTGQLIVE